MSKRNHKLKVAVPVRTVEFPVRDAVGLFVCPNCGGYARVPISDLCEVGTPMCTACINGPHGEELSVLNLIKLEVTIPITAGDSHAKEANSNTGA